VRETRLLSAGLGMDYLRRVLEVYCCGFSSLLNYDAQPYDGPTVLFKAGEGACRYGGITDPQALGWRPLASCLHVIEIDGDHFSILGQPLVKALASKMQQVLTDFR
jgi:thioesterase domain-containing protein